MVQIALIGEFDPTFEPHTTIASSVAHTHRRPAERLEEIVWLDTITCSHISDSDLSRFGGFWIAPGSPYKSMEGAMRVIEFARNTDIPLLGTCGGFQHIVLEYARNVMGFTDAQHAEYDPYASRLFINELQCSLAGQSMTVDIQADSVAARAYMASVTIERYYCNFGLNLAYLDDLKAAGMVVSGIDTNGEPRIIEIPGLRLFVGTLFVPQASSRMGSPHPIVSAFTKAVNDLHGQLPG